MAIDDNTSYELTGAQVKDLASKINAKADSSSLATVATSGDYGDLLNKPTIPTVNDAALTIQHNGTNVQTFTANASSNVTANIETIYADTITPTTAVATIGTTQIADGAVTNAKIDWSTLNYMPGDTLSINDDNFNLSGRLWVSGSNKYAFCALPLDKKVDSSVSTVTFTQTNYLNIYGGSALVFSQNTSSSIVWTVTKSATVSNTLLFKIQLPSATSITTNTCCSLDFKGTITFA